MGIYFTATLPTLHWRTGCPYDERTFGSYEEAVEAGRSHPVGGCDDAVQWVPDTYGWSEEELVAFRDRYDRERARLGQWPDWCVSGLYATAVTAEEAPSVALSQTNGVEVLRVLGFASSGPIDPDVFPWSGSADPVDFIGRVLTADGLSPVDPGRPMETTRGAGGATLIDAGRPAGYMQATLSRLHALGEWARERDVPVTWG